jgi:hypothetical protein
MSAVVLDDAGKNIGSAYAIVSGYAWSVMVERNGVFDLRRGRQQDEMIARYAMVAGAREMGIENPVLLEF